MAEYTISEEGTLPSNGQIYNKTINPNFKIRSMTTEEEMKRLGHSELPYKVLPEIIDDCLVDKIGINTYDLCIADYQYLLFKLRTATYGNIYKVSTVCPVCGAVNDNDIDLDSLEINSYSPELDKYLNITLPKSGDRIKLRMQTPRLMDEIVSKTNSFTKKSKNVAGDPAFLFTLESLIETVNDTMYDAIKLNSYIRRMSAADANYILKCAKKLNDGFGLNTKINCTCSKCSSDFNYQLPITGEFFGPEID